MDIERITSLLRASASTIHSASSFSDKLNVVYEILDNAFPKTSTFMAVHGPIKCMTDFMSRNEIEPLLQVLKKSSDSSKEFFTNDAELNLLLKNIYVMVKE